MKLVIHYDTEVLGHFVAAGQEVDVLDERVAHDLLATGQAKRVGAKQPHTEGHTEALVVLQEDVLALRAAHDGLLEHLKDLHREASQGVPLLDADSAAAWHALPVREPQELATATLAAVQSLVDALREAHEQLSTAHPEAAHGDGAEHPTKIKNK